MSEMYDSEDGKDAWKQYRRLIESIDPAVQSMLHTFGSEQYQYGYSAALDAAREAVNGLPVYDDHGALKPFKPDTAVIYAMDALAAIDALRQERSGNHDTPPSAENEAIDALHNQEQIRCYAR